MPLENPGYAFPTGKRQRRRVPLPIHHHASFQNGGGKQAITPLPVTHELGAAVNERTGCINTLVQINELI